MLERVWGKTVLVATTCGSLDWSAIREISTEKSQEAKMELPYGPAMPLMSIFSEDCESYHRNVQTPVPIASLAPTVKTQIPLDAHQVSIQCNCGIHTHTHTMGFQSDVEKNEVILFLGNWIDYWKLLFFKLRDTQQIFCAFLGSQSWSSFPNCHCGVKAAIDKV